jgi:hypothetical protein
VPRHRRPAPEQGLLRFAWHDEADDRPDDQGDVDGPLAERVDRLRACWRWETRFASNTSSRGRRTAGIR